MSRVAARGWLLDTNVVSELRKGARCHPRVLAWPDGLIAATAQEHELGVVTRNTADFARAGVRLLDPWVSAA